MQTAHYLYRFILTLPLCLMLAHSGIASDVIDLSGTWQVRLDPKDKGVAEEWYSTDFEATIHLPGSLTEHGFGDKPTFNSPWVGGYDGLDTDKIVHRKMLPYLDDNNFKMSAWLQPNTVYVGAAWYRKTVDIPESWQGQRVVLYLERPHWETKVWVGSEFVSTNNALGTPHEHDLTQVLSPGQHTITVRVDNRMIVDVGKNSHSVTDHTQSNWNGIVGNLELYATPTTWIDEVQVFPSARDRSAKVDVVLKGGAVESLSWQVLFEGEKYRSGEVAPGDTVDGQTEFIIDFGDDVKLWDEFTPNLYELVVTLQPSGHTERVKFGIRDLDTAGTRFKINGRNLFLRGTLECAIFPLTGYPPTDVDSWRRIIRICKEHGLNHIRFHSWCPPKAAFIAADELGFYYQVEASSWPNQGSRLGDGKLLDTWLYEEGHRMMKYYGNHPSFALSAFGNEPAGKNRRTYLDAWCEYWKEKNPRALHTGGAGWPRVPKSDFHNVTAPRIQQWSDGLDSRIHAKAPETITDYAEIIRNGRKPTIAHEIGQWCAYPNFDEMKKYTGVLKPKNFEIFQEILVENHMGDQARDFLMASGKLQTIAYKEEIESSLRTPEYGGFQLLDLRDFPGQGTALVGMLDPFWDPKPYVTAEEIRRFCDVTVPLARMEKRAWTRGDTFKASLEVSHFGAKAIQGAQPYAKILSEAGEVIETFQLSKRHIPIDNCIDIGSVEMNLRSMKAPAKYRLVVGIEKTDIENDWEFWVYPETAQNDSDEVHVAQALTPEVLDTLSAGGKVLLLLDPEAAQTEVKMGFATVFWNTFWTGNKPPHTMGILCDPEHPAFADFPTEFHTNWQWWELLHQAGVMILDDFDPEFRPLVQPIDTWFEARRLGLLFEAQVNGGKLMVTSMDLSENLDERAVARQLRSSLLAYMETDAFAPTNVLPAESVTRLTQTASAAE